MQRRHAWAVGLALAALGSGTAFAEQQSTSKQQAAALAAQGEQLGQDKRFDAALSKFKEAHALDPDTPAYLCNIGNAYYALANYPRAHLYLSRCRAANGGTWPAGVREVFEYVEGSLSKQDYTPVTINGKPDGAQVELSFYADEGPSKAPVTLYVPFGRYEVIITAEGYAPSRVLINATDRNPLAPSYQLSETSGGNASSGDTGTSTTVGDTGSGASFVTGSDITTGVAPAPAKRKKWPLLVAGAGGVAAVGGLIVFSSAVDISNNGCGDDVSQDSCTDRLRSREIISYSLLGVGAVAIGTGLVLYFSQSTTADQGLAVSASPIEGGGMVFMSFRN